MKRHMLFALMIAALLVAASCSTASETDSETSEAAPDPTIGATASSDPLSGIWTGDWGPSERDRNDVRLELKWDGVALSGTVNPGEGAIPLSKASYDPTSGVVMMEAEAPGRGGATIHYIINGKVEGGMMSGSWSHDDRMGDFKLTKS